MTALRVLVIGILRAYRACISPYLGPSCRFEPSCSLYAVEAVSLHGVCRGGWLTLQRLVRCAPWGGQGLDPVPRER
ncbi:MAG: membrane protein insertion efficiency factor YidD [Myxococcota bacterium]